MSASREKKTRQQTAGQLTEKQLKAQKEAAASKRNAVIYTVVGVVCAVLAIVLLVWNSGFFQGRAKALEVDGQTFTVTDAQYYYNQVYSQYYMQANYGMDIGLDINTPLDEQMYDEENGVTWQQQIKDEAVETMTEIAAASKAAREAGYTLSEEGRQSVQTNLKSLVSSSANYGYSSVNSYLKAVYGKSMTKGKLKTILERNMLAQEFEEKYAEELTYTDEDLTAYYTEHADDMDQYTYDYVTVDSAAEATTDSAGNVAQPTDETKAAARAEAEEKANAIADALREGAETGKLESDYEEDEKVTVQGGMTTQGSYLSTVFGDWLKESGRAAGEVTVIENEDSQTFYVVRFTARARDEAPSADVRHILVAAEQDEGAEEPTDAQYDAAKAKAEQMLADWKAGEATEESFAALAEKESADPGSAANGGLYEQVSATTGFIAEFTDWVLDPDRQPGDTGLVQNTESDVKGWHILYYVKQNDAAWQIAARSALRNADTESWIEELTSGVEVTRLPGLDSVK